MKAIHLPFAALIAAMMVSGSATAKAGDVQVKIFATYVAPDGKITAIKTDEIGLPAGTQSKADDNVTPTVAIEYFLSDAVSLETIAGVTVHHVDGRGALGGATLVSDASIVPATLTFKYHLGKEGGIRPYVGAGPSYFIFIDEKPGATTRALGATRQKMGDKLGAALQAGVDIPLNDRGFAISIDTKRYFLRPTATWYAGRTEVLKTRHKLDPWVVSVGAAFRF